MDLLATITKDLKTVKELTDIITGIQADGTTGIKIHPEKVAPEGTEAPYLNIYYVSGNRANDIPVLYPILQFSAFSKSGAQSRAIKKIIEDRYINYKGQPVGAAGVKIIKGTFGGEAYDREDDTGLNQAVVFINFKCWDQ